MDSGSKESTSKIAAAIAAAFMVTTSTVALAETGESPQSQNTTVSIIIPERVSVREVDEVSAGGSALASDEQAAVNLCVWSQGGAADAYQVTVISDTGDYKLTNAESSGDVDFTVEWRNQATQSNGTAVPYNTATPLVPLAPTTPTCGGAGNANSTIVVDIADGDLSLQEANAAGYDATLTVTVAAAP